MARKMAVTRRLLATALACAFGASLSGCAFSIQPKERAYSASAQSLLYNSDAGIGNVAKLLEYVAQPAWQRAPRAIDSIGGGGLIPIDSCGATIRSNGTHRAGYFKGTSFYRMDGLARDLLSICVFKPHVSDADPIRAAIDSVSSGKVSGAEELPSEAVLGGAVIERALRLYSRVPNAAGETEIYTRFFLQFSQGGETRVLVLSFLNAFSSAKGEWSLCLSPAECRAWVGSVSFGADT